MADTIDDFKAAVALAKQRTREASHDTGYSILVDNSIAGHMGDNGVVGSWVKTRAGVRRRYFRDAYRKLLWRSKVTGQGLLALFNPELKLWEYYRTGSRGGAHLELTGSTEKFQH